MYIFVNSIFNRYNEICKIGLRFVKATANTRNRQSDINLTSKTESST